MDINVEQSSEYETSSSGSYSSDGPVSCFNPYGSVSDNRVDIPAGTKKIPGSAAGNYLTEMYVSPPDVSQPRQDDSSSDMDQEQQDGDSSDPSSYSSDGPISCFNPFEIDLQLNESHRISANTCSASDSTSSKSLQEKQDGEADGDSSNTECSPGSSYTSDGPILCFNPFDPSMHLVQQQVITEGLVASDSSSQSSYSSDGPITCFNPYEQDTKGQEDLDTPVDQQHIGSMIQTLKINDALEKPTGVMPQELLDEKMKDAHNVFVATRGFMKVGETLKQSGHITITGAVGEGKTTMALMLGMEYRRHGYHLFMVQNIHNFDIKVLMHSSSQPSFVIFDDVFGSVGMRTDIAQLDNVLHQLILLLKQGWVWPITKGLVVVFTTNTYNLNEGLQTVGGEGASTFFSRETVIDLSEDEACYTEDERLQIFQIQTIHDTYYSPLRPQDMMSGQIGFPLQCRFGFEFGANIVDTIQFLSHPLDFLRQELSNILCARNSQSAALMMMLLCEDNIDLTYLGLPSENFRSKVEAIRDIVAGVNLSHISDACRNLRGTLFRGGRIISFSHPVIYDVCALALATQNMDFVLSHCSMQFIFERIRPYPGKNAQMYEDNNIIYISSEYYHHFVQRLKRGIDEGEYSFALTHPMLNVETVEKAVLQYITRQYGGSCDETEHGVLPAILHCFVLGQNVSMVKGILRTISRLPIIEICALLKSCAACGNYEVLKLLLSTNKTKFTDFVILEAFLLASQNEHELISNYLLEYERNLSNEGIFSMMALMMKDDTPLYVLYWFTLSLIGFEDYISLHEMAVTSGLDRTCERLIKVFEMMTHHRISMDSMGNKVEYLVRNGAIKFIIHHFAKTFGINRLSVNGRTPIMHTVSTGQTLVFNLLVKEGADLTLTEKYGDTVLHLACQEGSESIVEQLLPSFDIDIRGNNGWTPVMVAAISGKKEVYYLLVTEGADLTLTDNYGDTVLHLACQGGNTCIVKHLLPSFDINTRGQHGWTPVMNAAYKGWKEVLELLKNAGADVTLTDDYGDTIVHIASMKENSIVVEHLLHGSLSMLE